MATIGEVGESKEFVIQWKIKKFFSIPLEVDTFYYSPLFSFGNAKWRLQMYPNGQKRKGTDGAIDLYLSRKSSGPSIRLEYTLGIKTRDETLDPEKHLTYVFEDKESGYGCFGLLYRTNLLKRKSDFAPSDILTFVCKIKGSKPSEVASESSETEKSVLCEKNKVLQDFKQLLENQEDCDVIIRVKEKEFPAHKAILKVRSPVLASTLRNDMKEKQTGIIDIQDCEPSIFSEFLCFLYYEGISNLSEENVFGLFILSDKYDVPDLTEKCTEFIKSNLSIDTFCETMTLALRHDENELIKLSTDFFIKNAQNIIETVKWQSFLADNPTQSNELFIKLLASK